MNVSLICEKKIYNFDLPLETKVKYLKKLSCRLFKTEILDIYYRGDKIKIKENDKSTLLKDLVNADDANIKLKIVLNPTLNSTKNQTPSTFSNSIPATFKTLDLGGSDIVENSNKILLIKKHNNLLFEALFTQKTKKFIFSIKEFNKKIIEINNFLFKKKTPKDKYLSIFEKNLYEFIDNLNLYFKKLISNLEKNNYVTYNEMIQNLNFFYHELNINENNIYNDIEKHELNCQTSREIDNYVNSSPLNKFPINLKKSDKNYTLNSERCNFFNKSTKKPSIKKYLFLSEKDFKANPLDLKEKKDNRKNLVNKAKYIKLNDSNNISHELDFITDDEKGKNEEKGKDINEANNFSDIYRNSINNISCIKVNKSMESEKNIMNEEEIKNLNINISNESINKSLKKISNKNLKQINTSRNKEKPVLKLDSSNSTIENKKTKSDFNNSNRNSINNIMKANTNKSRNNNNSNNMNKILAEEMKAYKKKMNFIPSFMPKQLNVKKQPAKKMNSTIHENENENLSNSSYDYTHNFKDTKNKKKEDEKNEDKKKEDEKTEDEKTKNEKTEDKKTEDKKSEVKQNESDDNISNLIKQLSSSKSINKKESKINEKSLPKVINISDNENKIENTSDNENKIDNNDINGKKRIGNLPIYNMSASKVGISKPISRKTSSNKKKNVTNNKYDFLI